MGVRAVDLEASEDRGEEGSTRGKRIEPLLRVIPGSGEDVSRREGCSGLSSGSMRERGVEWSTKQGRAKQRRGGGKEKGRRRDRQAGPTWQRERG